MQNSIICLMGPTGSGKTQAAIELIQHLPCAIISVDSAMVYRDMDVGTAKPSAAILAKDPHALIDICDASEVYSAGRFCQDVSEAINAAQAVGKLPLLVGGTMLYFRALQQGLSDLPRAKPELREELLCNAREFGWPALHARLAAVDMLSARRIHAHDAQRIQRALEIYYITGRAPSLVYQEQQLKQPYRYINLALMPADRAQLHLRIAERFSKMLKEGLLEEVAHLYQRGDLTADLPSMRAVGYRQVWQYLAGEYDYAEMQARAIAATRQLAKRQFTWLRSWSEISYFASEDERLIDQLVATIKQRLLI